jgi:hypothetical protein
MAGSHPGSVPSAPEANRSERIVAEAGSCLSSASSTSFPMSTMAFHNVGSMEAIWLLEITRGNVRYRVLCRAAMTDSVTEVLRAPCPEVGDVGCVGPQCRLAEISL